MGETRQLGPCEKDDSGIRKERGRKGPKNGRKRLRSRAHRRREIPQQGKLVPYQMEGLRFKVSFFKFFF